MDEATKSLILSKKDMRAAPAPDGDNVIKLDVWDADKCVRTSSSPYWVDFCLKRPLPNAL